MKNSAEMLICLEILKQCQHIKAEAPWWMAFMDIQNISNYSTFIYKPTKEIHDKQVPKYDFDR